MGSSVFATRYVIGIEYSIDRKWHVNILINVCQITLRIMKFIKLI